MKRLFILFVLFSLGVTAQDNCTVSDNKSVKKLISKVKAGKIDLSEKVDLMRDAVELDENSVEVQFLLGENLYKQSKINGDDYGEAIESLILVKSTCPDFSSNVYYYLGIMYYAQSNWKDALTSFKGHQAFSNEAKKARNYDRKATDVESVILELEFKTSIKVGEKIVKTKVKGVSGPNDDYLPALSPDNELMFFTHLYEKKGMGDFTAKKIEEFTVSKRSGIGAEFSKGQALPYPFNRGVNYGGATISIDNKEMFITICQGRNCDIYSSRNEKGFNERTQKEEYMWSEFEKLGANINTENGWESQPSLSADGNTLYFATARENSTKNANGDPSIDIYYSTRVNGTWGKAQTLGADINTGRNEKSPFMHGDSKTLYFSSDKATGVGKYDIYFSKLLDDGTWTKPRNIGVPINTENDEHGMIVSTDGKEAYYASNKEKGSEGYDIYSFAMPMNARPEKVVLIKGTLKDEDGKAITDAKMELKYINSKIVERIDVNTEGEYAKMINIETEPVVLKIEKEGYAFKAQVFSRESTEDTPVVKSEVLLEKVEVGKPYRIDDIQYETASAEINENSKLILEEFAAYLSDNKTIKISIHGHTDNVGSDSKNLELSELRATEIKALLIGQNVPADRLSSKGFGSSKPIADNSTESGKRQNRRTEFVIISK